MGKGAGTRGALSRYVTAPSARMQVERSRFEGARLVMRGSAGTIRPPIPCEIGSLRGFRQAQGPHRASRPSLRSG